MMLQFIDNNDDAFERTNLIGHFTSSAIIVNPEMTKVLFIHHNIYNSWGWVGGHNDGDKDFLKVSIKEAKEETGVVNIRPYNKDIIGLDSIYVYNHIKNGKFVSDHIHMNVTYLLVASETEILTIKPDENSGVKWFDLEGALEIIEEPRMKPIYTKYFNYVKAL
jgi:ADP-ribose pyrophosphatase YjhB (NUDIX family)